LEPSGPAFMAEVPQESIASPLSRTTRRGRLRRWHGRRGDQTGWTGRNQRQNLLKGFTAGVAAAVAVVEGRFAIVVAPDYAASDSSRRRIPETDSFLTASHKRSRLSGFTMYASEPSLRSCIGL
jgi:hypothetical protein